MMTKINTALRVCFVLACCLLAGALTALRYALAWAACIGVSAWMFNAADPLPYAQGTLVAVMLTLTPYFAWGALKYLLEETRTG